MILPIKIHRFEDNTDTIANHTEETLDYGEMLYEASTGYFYVSPKDGTKISELKPINEQLPAKRVATDDERIYVGFDSDNHIGNFSIDLSNGNLVGMGGGDRTSRGLVHAGVVDSYLNGLQYLTLSNDIGAGSIVGQLIYGKDDPNTLTSKGELFPTDGQVYFRLKSGE